MERELILEKLILLADSFEKILNKSNPTTVFSLLMQGKNRNEIRQIQYFDWFQGVGIYGFYKAYQLTNDDRYLNVIRKYFSERIKDGLPPKNINSMAPLLTMIHLYEDGFTEYEDICIEWSSWLYHEMPRTREGGFQHVTLDSPNTGELWDDTLFMSVLFLAKAGIVFNKKEYVEEAIYQFQIHAKYLVDDKTGLWYHGWTFEGNHNFVEALWARGNSWITIFVPEFLEYLEDYNISESVKKELIDALTNQIRALAKYQHESGLWHTLINDKTSYLESSGSAGFSYGILKATRKNLIDKEYYNVGEKAVYKILDLITSKGDVKLVSAGTAMGKKSLNFYKKIPKLSRPYGPAMTMLMLIEYLENIDN